LNDGEIDPKMTKVSKILISCH